ncbi:MAG: thioredoxin domain-containing protein [bacterium]|nr:thioredoxin domain-containing protein [bacterium]
MTDPKHTNRLIGETSPYLLQHAHNPVDWFPWCDEVLQKAVEEDRPIFLSIGYSACHWCHVMEHESFENESIAEIMNAHFMNIKVDREERPDLDEIYMNAVQMMTGSGGWPMSIFLTPQGQPFYGGTYFPPDNRYGRPGFPQVLESVAQHYRNHRDKVSEAAGRLMDGLHRMAHLKALPEALEPGLFSAAFAQIAGNFDKKNGGFGTQPKFPNTMNLSICLREWVRRANQEALDMVVLTLEKMARGGIYDQLGGGFHRYSVDHHWLAPHFEKMLYDNALLARLYVEAFQVTRKPLFQRVVDETLAYVIREMTHPEGGFYSTQDADSEGEEGKFFVWESDEVQALLGEEDAALFERYFDIRSGGNFEHGMSILNVPEDLEALSRFLQVTPEKFQTAIEKGKRILFDHREKRVKPGLDDKIQVNWNGLMISAFAVAYQAFGDPAYLEAGSRAAQFILDNMRSEAGGLCHIWKDGKAGFHGYQDDCAFLIAGLIDLYEASFDLAWLKQAQELTETMIAQFWDEKEGGFFYTGTDHEALIVRSKNPYDNAIPSGNSVGAFVLMRLGALLGREDFWDKAERTIRLFQPFLKEMPSGFGHMACALDFFQQRPVEVAIVGSLTEADTRALVAAVNRNWMPNRVVSVSDLEGGTADWIPLLVGKTQVDGRAAAYVCQNFTCSAPVTDSEELVHLLESPPP